MVTANNIGKIIGVRKIAAPIILIGSKNKYSTLSSAKNIIPISGIRAIISAITLGMVYFGEQGGAVFPLVLAAVGILASMIGTFFVKGKDGTNPHSALKAGTYTLGFLEGNYEDYQEKW